MTTRIWLHISGRGNVRVTKTQTGTKVNEVMMQLDLSVPDALFRRPRLEGRITIEAGEMPDVLKGELVKDVTDQLSEMIGTEVILTVVTPEEGS